MMTENWTRPEIFENEIKSMFKDTYYWADEDGRIYYKKLNSLLVDFLEEIVLSDHGKKEFQEEILKKLDKIFYEANQVLQYAGGKDLTKSYHKAFIKAILNAKKEFEWYVNKIDENLLETVKKQKKEIDDLRQVINNIQSVPNRNPLSDHNTWHWTR
jgi:hypothetical protein